MKSSTTELELERRMNTAYALTQPSGGAVQVPPHERVRAAEWRHAAHRAERGTCR